MSTHPSARATEPLRPGTLHRLALAWVLAGMGCGGAGELTLADAFEVTVTLTYLDEAAAMNPYLQPYLPARTRLFLRLDDHAEGTRAIASPQYVLEAAAFTRLADGTRELAESFQVRTVYEDRDPCSSHRTNFSDMHLMPRDDDGDGVPERLEGTARGQLRFDVDGIGVRMAFEATLAGTLDRTPPDMEIAGITTGHHVMQPIFVRATELVHPEVTVRLRAETGQGVALLPAGASPLGVELFATPEDWLLPFDTELAVEVEPALRDLAGNQRTQVSATVRTMADPGLFAQDGFEGPARVALDAGAAIVDGVGALPALDGARSLLLVPGSRATLRLAAPEGSTRARMRARLLVTPEGPNGLSTSIRLAFHGSAAPVRLEVFPEPALVDGREDTGDDQWTEAGPIFDIEALLPAGTAGDVIVTLDQPDHIGCGGRAPPPMAILVDDLRVE